MARIVKDFLACLLVLVLMLTGLAQGVHAARAPGSVVICAAAGPVEIPLPGGDLDRAHCPLCLPPSLAAALPGPLPGPSRRIAATTWHEPRVAMAARRPGVTTIRGPPGQFLV
jgi:hypothetical protein